MQSDQNILFVDPGLFLVPWIAIAVLRRLIGFNFHSSDFLKSPSRVSRERAYLRTPVYAYSEVGGVSGYWIFFNPSIFTIQICYPVLIIFPSLSADWERFFSFLFLSIRTQRNMKLFLPEMFFPVCVHTGKFYNLISLILLGIQSHDGNSEYEKRLL